jgi:TolA-binding protein
MEGYLPNSDSVATLEAGLGRIACVRKKYADAERWYGDTTPRFAQSHQAPEAIYWRAVAHYKATNDHTALDEVAEELQNRYPSSVWAAKSIPWLPGKKESAE